MWDERFELEAEPSPVEPAPVLPAPVEPAPVLPAPVEPPAPEAPLLPDAPLLLEVPLLPLAPAPLAEDRPEDEPEAPAPMREAPAPEADDWLRITAPSRLSMRTSGPVLSEASLAPAPAAPPLLIPLAP